MDLLPIDAELLRQSALGFFALIGMAAVPLGCVWALAAGQRPTDPHSPDSQRE